MEAIGEILLQADCARLRMTILIGSSVSALAGLIGFL